MLVAAVGSLGALASPALADTTPGSTSPTATATAASSTTVTTVVTTTTAAQAPGAASHATTTTQTTTTGTTPTPPKHKPAVAAKLTLRAPDALLVRKKKAVLPRSFVKVTGTVSRYVPGQKVEIKASLNKHVFHSGKLAINRGAHGTGTFTATVRPRRAGILRVQASHKQTAALRPFSQVIGITSLDTNVHFGSSSLFVDLVQARLSRLHFYIPQTGVWDTGTELAIDAYHRLLDRGTSTVLDKATLNALIGGKGRFAVRFPNQGRHVEGNLGKQLVALIVGSKVHWIFPISSGKPSTPTILGSFRVYRRQPGYLPDGMYYSDFFIRGYALHGYDPAPDYPASHGCMRLPIQDAIPAFNWLAMGDWVDVYQGSGNYAGTI